MATTCTDCGEELSDDNSAACSACGGTAKTYHLQVHDTVQSQTVDEAYISEIGYGPRDWTHLWFDLVHHQDQIRSLYASPRTDNLRLRRSVEAFMTASAHLFDGLYKTAALTKKAIRTYMDGSPGLEVSQGFANTWKHFGRSEATDLRAEITRYARDQDSCSMTVTYGSEQRPDKDIDALALADMCVTEWRALLQQNGLTPPA